MDYSSFTGYLAACDVLVGILIPPLLILWILSFFFPRQKRDPVRKAFAWMKFVYPIFIFALILALVNFILVSKAIIEYENPALTAIYPAILKGCIHTGAISMLLGLIGDLMLLITFVELSNAFFRILGPDRSHAWLRAVRLITFLVTFTLFILLLSWFGRQQFLWEQYFSNGRDGPEFNDDLFVIARLLCVIEVLMLACSMATSGLAYLVLHKVRTQPLLRSSAIIALVANILFVLRFVWLLMYNGAWIFPGTEDYAPASVLYADIILYLWLMFAILVLLYILGKRKQNGLWSTEQPWHVAQTRAIPLIEIPSQQPRQNQPYEYFHISEHPQHEPAPISHSALGPNGTAWMMPQSLVHEQK